MKTKRSEEVAYQLLDVVTIFGAQCISHSDNWQKFANKVIGELWHLWNEPKVAHGKQQYSQSQRFN